MIKLRHASAILVLALLGSNAFGGEDVGSGPRKSVDSPNRSTPQASCPLTCKVVRVSTRCECPMGKSPVSTTV
jgi:hypothetical protein